MNRIIYTSLLCLALSFHACDLNVIPDNIPTIEDNAFALRVEAEKVLFTCYGFIQKDGSLNDNPALVGANDYAITTTFRSNAGVNSWYIALGQQKIDGPYCNQWDDLYKGITYCNLFLENIHKTPDMEDYEKERWISEVEFLKAYYHFCLVRMYGPVPIMDKYIPVDAETGNMHRYRNTLDECFEYIVNLLDKIITEKKLPLKIENEAEEMGRITQGIVMAQKAKVLLTAASPLFNGNTDYVGLTDNRGIEIFAPNKSEQEKAERWSKAADACKEAISFFEGQGFGLHTFNIFSVPEMLPSDCIMMNLRNAVTEKWNNEIVWANTQSWVGNGSYSLQIQSMPRDLAPEKVAKNAVNRNNLAVSLNMTNAFYTKNGVPIEEDKSWDYENRLNLTVTPDTNSDNMLIPNYTTVGLNIDREYRYYGSLGFDGNIWFGQGQTQNSTLYQVRVVKGHVVLKPSDHSQNLTGIWPKKLVHYRTVTGETSGFTSVSYPFPIIRMADLYLMYAEALNECGTAYTTVLPWIDKVRKRSELKGVEESWSNFSRKPSKFTTTQGLREIIMQERRIELAFEGHFFWDVRRWKTAVKELSKSITGWNVKDTRSASEYYQEKTLFQHEFTPRDYFWPIALSELRKNPNLIQNYGW